MDNRLVNIQRSVAEYIENSIENNRFSVPAINEDAVEFPNKKSEIAPAIPNNLRGFAYKIQPNIWIGDIPKPSLSAKLNDVPLDTIAEEISDNADYRKWIRTETYKLGTLVSKIKRNAVDEDKIFEIKYKVE